jgi:hypothetical protein
MVNRTSLGRSKSEMCLGTLHRGGGGFGLRPRRSEVMSNDGTTAGKWGGGSAMLALWGAPTRCPPSIPSAYHLARVLA